MQNNTMCRADRKDKAAIHGNHSQQVDAGQGNDLVV